MENSNGYIRIPKLLFNRGISCEAILLYGLLLDRNSLSETNKERFADKEGKIYVFCKIDSVCSILSCGKEKAVKLLRELELHGLITKKRKGAGKPSAIYIHTAEDIFGKTDCMNSENNNSSTSKIEIDEFGKSVRNNTNINNTNINNTYSTTYNYAEVEERIKEQIEFNILSERNYGHLLVDLVLIMTDVICSISPTVRIGKEEKSREAVRSRLFSLDSTHIEYVIDCFNENKGNIKNIRSYLLVLLFEAPVTMESYYDNMVGRYYKGLTS